MNNERLVHPKEERIPARESAGRPKDKRSNHTPVQGPSPYTHPKRTYPSRTYFHIPYPPHPEVGSSPFPEVEWPRAGTDG